MKYRTCSLLLSAMLVLSGSSFLACSENDSATHDSPSDNPGENPGETPSENPGENPGETPSENPGENPGETPSENPGENPGQNPGENPGQNPGENPGQNPGENPGQNPGENPGQNPPKDEFDIVGGRLLSENIVKYYELSKGQVQPTRYLTLVDFTTAEFADHANTKYTNQYSNSYQFNYADGSISLRTPSDLSDYERIAFDVYIPESAVNQTLYMYFLSENSTEEGMDYYGKLLKFDKAGWNKIDLKLTAFGKSRNPLGWHHIDKLVLTPSGWNQTNATETTIYLENMILRNDPAAHEDVETTLIDFSASAYSANASSTYHKTGTKSYEWKYTTHSVKFPIPQDLSKYEGISFWVYAPKEAVNETFYMQFPSENSAEEGSDYYGKTIKLTREGWNKFAYKRSEFSASRSPRGWNDLDKTLVLTSTGWSQANSENTTIYLDNFILHSNADAFAQAENVSLPGAAFSIHGGRAIVDHVLINASHDDENSLVFVKNDEFWLPLSVFGARYDNAAVYNPKTQSLQMTLNGKMYQYKGGKNTVNIDGKDTPLDFTVAVNGDTLFAPASYIKKWMNYSEEYIDEMGMIYLSKSKESFNSLSERLNIMYETLFLRPTGAELISRINATMGGDVHPRIMLTQADFDRLKALINVDPTFTAYYEQLVKKYGPDSKEFNDAPVEYSLTDGVRLLAISRKAKNRIIPWAFLYKMTGQAQYAVRIWTEVNALINFSDWHPVHYLDTAEILYAMAIAFDWLYDVWSTTQRAQMTQKVVEYGLETGLDRYEGRASKWGNSNWSGVCNGGLTSAALAYVNEPDARSTAQKVLDYSLKDVELSLYTYAPDGGYLESPGYWSYGTDYIHVLISSVKSAAGANFGLFHSPGFAKSAMFTTYLENDAGSWGFHDSGSGQTDTTTLQWFARETKDGGIGRIRQNSIDNKLKSVHVYDAMWYTPDNIANEVKLNLDAYFSQVGSFTMRDSWNAGATLVGLHGGNNSASHGDLDIGNFIIFGSGKRFITELGSDNYNLPNYFGDKREWYYRKRAEGQNTLVIGDVSYKTPDQVKKTIAEFTRHESNQNNGIAIVDMTSAYTAAKSGQRGLWFKDNRSTIVLQDEMTLKSPEIVRWTAHTEGDITIEPDGKHASISFPNTPKRLYAEIVSPDTSLKFTSGSANSYDPEYPASFSESQKENSREKLFKLMVITPKAVTNFKSAIVFKFVDTESSDPESGKLYTWTDMSKWKLQ